MTGKDLAQRQLSGVMASPLQLPPLLTSLLGDVHAEASPPPPPAPGQEPTYLPRWEVPQHVPSSTKQLIPGALGQLERALTPAEQDDIVAALHRLAAHFYSERPKAAWQVVFEDYARLLGDVPLDILEDGLDAYLRRGKWFPKLAELLEHTGPLLRARRILQRRLHELLRTGDQPKPTAKTYADMTPEEKAGWDRRFERLKSSIAPGAPQPVSKVAERVTDRLLLPMGSAEPF